MAGGFDVFLADLGSGTRSRLLGSRARLTKAGQVRERILRPEELEEGWEIFSRLHEQRWQRPFNLHWRRFYGAIATIQASGGVPVLSVLKFEGQPVPVLVNFRAGLREYSMASAFILVDVKRVPIGWMHLGLALERACANGKTHFDFLGGEGKHEQDKAAFGGDPPS